MIPGKLLGRQLKRAFGFNMSDDLERFLSGLPDGGLREGLPVFLESVEAAYGQYERDLQLRTRSLEVSSQELSDLNEKLRCDAETQRQALSTLRGAVNSILGKIGMAAISDDDHNLASLTSMMATLAMDRESALEQARSNQMAAEEASRAKSLFLANMSHEIRTPLNGVLATAELLEDTALDVRQKKFVDTIQSSGELLLGLLNDILDISKIEAGKLEINEEPFDLRRNFETILDLFSSSAQTKGLKFIMEIAKDLPKRVISDPHRLRQVMGNLLNNAIKYTERGFIHVEVGIKRRDDSDFLSFRVTDTGNGISKEKHASIFEKFTQAHKSEVIKGTGLGLAICKSLVEIMGGTIGVTSEPGLGSTFWFELPLRAAPAEEPDKDNGKPEVATAGRYRVLVAEDVAVNQMVLTEMLEGIGCVVDMASDGSQAVEKASENRYDIILMDCNMPVMDGYEATRKIREICGARTPIVAVSAHVFAQEIQSCLDAGMNDFLPKPVKKKALAEMVAKWVAAQDGANDDGRSVSSPPLAGKSEVSHEFDDSILAVWYRDMPTKADKLVDMTLANAAELSGGVEKSVADRDAVELAQSAHALKSVAAQIGGVSFAAACKELEMAGKKSDLSEVAAMVERFRAEYAAFCASVEAARGKKGAAP